MKCPWNQKYRCHIQKIETRNQLCPVQDQAFVEALDIWALTGRTCQSVRFDTIPGTDNAGDLRQVLKADMAVNFLNPQMILALVETQEIERQNREKYQKYKLKGYQYMTTYICKDLINGYSNWSIKQSLKKDKTCNNCEYLGLSLLEHGHRCLKTQKMLSRDLMTPFWCPLPEKNKQK